MERVLPSMYCTAYSIPCKHYYLDDFTDLIGDNKLRKLYLLVGGALGLKEITLDYS